MLEVEARDGAARTATVTIGDRKVALPNLFWTPSSPADATWDPQLDTRPNPQALLLVQPSLQTAAPAPQPGQLLLLRVLTPTPSMRQGQALLRAPDENLCVMTGALNLLRNPKRFAPALVAARREAGYGRALYAPGLGEPNHLALLAYAGLDLFDAAPLEYGAASRRYLTESGSYPADELADPMCHCPSCAGAVPRDQDEQALGWHNRHAARAELGAVRNAIRAGRLRELVEARVRSHPDLTALLRRFDAQYEYFEERAPVHRTTPLFANTKESLQRAECQRFRRRVEDRYVPPPQPPILLLLPCSHRKPYATSRTHRAVADAVHAAGAALLVHEVIVTSPLGLVPRELERCYPAAQYDVPVTGQWDEEEGAMIRSLLQSLLAKRPYAAVVAHLPRHTLQLVQSVLPPFARVTVAGEDATAADALAELHRVLREEASRHRRPDPAAVLQGRLLALATYQFGPEVAQRLFDGAAAKGRWPAGRIEASQGQLAMVPPERGLLSLTLEGAKRLGAAGAYAVEIDDFAVKGSVFAVGVRSADPGIRAGDEVVVHHQGEIRGVGVAAMNGLEMVQLRRGEAVRLRHHA